MKTLEGQEALSYFQRLVPTITECVTRYEKKIFQGQLLLAILSLDRALFESYPDNKELNVVVTASGFPLLTVSLAHVQEALRLQFQKIDQKRQIATDLLSALANLSKEQTDQGISKLRSCENQYPLIAQTVSALTQSQIDYLKELGQHPQDKTIFPFAVSQELPGVLLNSILLTPFYTFETNERANAKPTYFRKYIEPAPDYTTPNIVESSKEKPVVKPEGTNMPIPPHPRFPIIIAGTLDKNNQPLLEGPANTPMPGIPIYKIDAASVNEGKAPELVNFCSHTELTIRQIASSTKPPLKTSFLSIDFTSLSEKTIDTVVDAFPRIDNCLTDLVKLTNLVAANQPVDTNSLAQKADELFTLVGGIDDLPAQQKIQLAIAQAVPTSRNQGIFKLGLLGKNR